MPAVHHLILTTTLWGRYYHPFLFQNRQLRLREVKCLVQGHSQEGADSNPGKSIIKAHILSRSSKLGALTDARSKVLMEQRHAVKRQTPRPLGESLRSYVWGRHRGLPNPEIYSEVG